MLEKLKQEFGQAKNLLTFGALRATGQALTMGVPFVLARFFLPELFASYKLAMMVVFLFICLFINSAYTPFIVYGRQEMAETGRLSKSFSAQSLFFLFGLVVFSFLIITFRKAITAFAAITFEDLLFLYLAYIGLALKGFLCNLFMATGQRLKNAVAELLYGCCALSLVFVFYLTDLINLKMAFLAYFLSAIFTVVASVKSIDFHLLSPFGAEWENFKNMFSFAAWLMAGETAVYFVAWGDNLVLRFFVPMDDIGQYNLGYDVFKGVTILIGLSSAYFLPFISEHITDSLKIKNYLYKKRPRIFLLGTVLLVLLFLIAPYFFKVVYESHYPNSAIILRILLIGSLLIFYNSFYMPVLSALKKYKFITIVHISQFTLNLLLNLLLVPKLGIYGAAIATAIAIGGRIIVTEVYFRIILKKLLGLTA